MIRRFAFPLAAFMVILAMSVGLERTFSPVFQQCIAAHEHDKVASPDDNEPTGFFPVLNAYVGCSGDFVDSHGSGITALATLIIAAFTGTLWLATSKQVQLTRDALELLERAYIDVQIRLIMVGEQQLPYGIDRAVNVSYQLQNLGRTVAVVTDLHQDIFLSETRSRVPEPQRSRASKLLRPVNIAPRGEFNYGVYKKLDAVQQQQLTSNPPTLFAHLFLYFGYRDALPGTREPVVLTGVITVKDRGYGMIDWYQDEQPQEQEKKADPSKSEAS